MNRTRQVKGKFGHVVQIYGFLPFTKRFRKLQSKGKQNTTPWVVPAENFQRLRKRLSCFPGRNDNLFSISLKPSLDSSLRPLQPFQMVNAQIMNRPISSCKWYTKQPTFAICRKRDSKTSLKSFRCSRFGLLEY